MKLRLCLRLLLVTLPFACLSLFSLNPVYGLAGSLENLQKEVGNQTGYKGELDDYLSLHNVTFGVKDGRQLTLNDFDVYEMEDLVKSHMEYCQSTSAEEQAKNAYEGYEWALILHDKFVAANC